jgi:hypothetical protein
MSNRLAKVAVVAALACAVAACAPATVSLLPVATRPRVNVTTPGGESV